MRASKPSVGYPVRRTAFRDGMAAAPYLRPMPIYEYTCKDCGLDFERLVLGRTRPSCPECESVRLERRMSLPRVKSSGTHDLAMRAAKKRDAAQARDRMHERIRYEESHDRHG